MKKTYRNPELAMRIDILRENFGKQKDEFSELLGLKPPNYSEILSGSRPISLEILDNIYKKCVNVNMNWLFSGEGAMFLGNEHKSNIYEAKTDKNRFAAKESSIDNLTYIPLIEPVLSAGDGSLTEAEQQTDKFAFRKDWLHTVSSGTANCVLLKVSGDSMLPSINSGDMVLLDKGRTDIMSGRIYAIAIDDAIYVKRVEHRGPGAVTIFSDNREVYEPFKASLNEIRILGQIIWIARELI